MKFKYLHLGNSRKSNTNGKKTIPLYPGRRKFVKAMGFGALAWNPVVHSIQKIQANRVDFKLKGKKLRAYLNDVPVWEISEKYFSPGYSIFLSEEKNKWILKAAKLKLKHLDFSFSITGEIEKNSGDVFFTVPQLNFEWNGNFVRWLEGDEKMQSWVRFLRMPILTDQLVNVNMSGSSSICFYPNWQIEIANAEINLKIFNNQYTTSNLLILSDNKNRESFLKANISGASTLQFGNFASWNSFIGSIELREGSLYTQDEIPGDLTLLIKQAKNGIHETVLCASQEKSNVYFETGHVAEQNIKLDRFFYFAEYLNTGTSGSYISATLPTNGLWITNQLGAFKIEKNNELPDLEAFGVANRFTEVVFEPRLRAYNPNISDAVTISSVFQDPPKVRITQPQKKVTGKTTRTTSIPTREIQKEEKSDSTANNRLQNILLQIQQNEPQRKTRDIQKKQPEIDVEFDRLKFRPKKALSIKLLRPEDLVMLEFVFHNFNFTNKGQSPYLELDDEKEAGIVEIYFQSQHTLEEAYYESTPIPDPEGGTTDTVHLPAKHLRARKSRLVYELPPNHSGFPLIMGELLDWSKYNLRVHPRAWIKIPAIKEIKKPTRFLLDKKSTIQPNKNIRFLNTPQTEYGIKLAQNNKLKVNNLNVYEENEVAKVLAPESAISVKPAFDIKTLKKISLKVEPVPELSTSIEAPALMYISPNQLNDFYHKVYVNFRDVQDLKFSTQQTLNTNLRVLDPLTTDKGEITELWHTRLGVKLKNGKTSGAALPHFKTIRALWADDANEDYTVPKLRNYPFMASLDANNRQKLVHTTSNYTAGFTPFPVPVNDLMLTTLGAYLDWHAFFDVPTPQDNALNIIEWEHIATLGRDHFVKIVEEGYLFPFGHRAAVVKITERKFHQQTKAAVNRQRMFVVVLEKELLYSRNDPNGEFIEFPFQAIRIDTNKTPNIDNPEDSTLINVPSSSAMRLNRTGLRVAGNSGGNTTYNFYINVGGKGFPFDIVATDKEGFEHAFRLPLAFMENRIARDASLMEDVIEVYRGVQANGFNKAYNEAGFQGSEVAYAPFLVDGDTAFETELIKFDAQVYPAQGAGDLKFHPRMKEAKVYVQQISELTGIKEPATIGLEDDNNKGAVFARVTSSNVVDFSGGSDKAGGFLMPNMSVSGLSKLQGPVSGALDNMKDLQFIPEDFFKAFEDLPVAKIFGVIQIFDLLFGDSGTPFDLGGAFDDLIDAVSGIREEIDNLKNEILYLENLAQETQQMVQEQIDELKQMIKDKVNELLSALNDSVPRIPNFKAYLTEEAFYAEYKWQPELGGTSIEVISGLLNVNVDNPSTALSVTTKFEKPFDADKPAAINGLARFEKFGIDIVPLLAVNFNYLEFRTGSSEKTDVKVDIDKNNPIEFKGVLNFVNNLQSIIPSDGFSDSGPYIKIQPTGVTAGFDIAIPNVEVGICMISNISLGANVTLPFTGAPLTMGFNFCRRENPFLLTVSCFGGGGYFMMVTTLKGLQSIEAAFEFGAAMSLNVGVASGGVSAMGGFYYKMELVEGEEQTTLTGYLRLNGHLSILGLISLSLEFYLAFIAVIYQGKVQKLEGVATLKVKVEVLFFSKTVSVSVRRELKGADADPKFIEMIDPEDWQDYCLAFANDL